MAVRWLLTMKRILRTSKSSTLCVPEIVAHSGSPRLQRLAELDRMRHRFVQLVHVEFALRAADHDAGHAIADQVGERAALAHEFIDADQDGDRLDRYVRHDGERRGKRNK